MLPLTTRVENLGEALEHRRGILRRMSLEREPHEKPSMPLGLERGGHATEKVGRVRSFERLCGKRTHHILLNCHEGSLNDGVHEPFSAAEVMEDGRVRHPDVRCDLLEPDPRGPHFAQPFLGGVQDEDPSLFCGTPDALLATPLLPRRHSTKGIPSPRTTDNFVDDLLTVL